MIDASQRVSSLKKLLHEKQFLKVIEAHSPLSAAIVDRTSITLANGKIESFDGIWESSLTDSLSKMLPDIEIVGLQSRLETVRTILSFTSKPMIFDGDTGGDCNQFAHMVQKLEHEGVSMVVIEDKSYPKRNSLLDVTHILEDPYVFAEKLQCGLKARKNKDFMIVARIESLIAGNTVEDAINRAKIYLEAGADGIVIHSKSNSPDEVVAFSQQYHQLAPLLITDKLLICIPTTYTTITTKELQKAGFHIVIYANHLFRAKHKAMQKTCENILFYGRTHEIEESFTAINELFDIVM